MQKRGTGLDELYETLKQFNTKSKSILPAGNSKAVVTFNFRGHDYMGWNIACTGEENPIHKLNGKRYDRFLIALKALYKTTTLFEIRNNDSVLCYRDTEPERDNGRSCRIGSIFPLHSHMSLVWTGSLNSRCCAWP